MPPPFSGSLVAKNRASLEEIADAMALDHSAVKLRTELIDRIRSELLARQDTLIDDERFRKLYVKPKMGRPSAKPASFKEEQDLTASVQVPLASMTDPSPPPSSASYLASQQQQQSAPRSSPRRSSPATGGPTKHTQSSASRRSSRAVEQPSTRSFETSSASSDAAEDDDDDEVGSAAKEEEAETGELSGEGSHALSSSSPVKALEPISTALRTLASPVGPTLAKLASPLKPVADRLTTELARARGLVEGVEHEVEGAVQGAGFTVAEVVEEGRTTRSARRARESVGTTVRAAVDEVASDGQQTVGSSLASLASLRQAAVGRARSARQAVGRPTTQAVLLLVLELAYLVHELLPPPTRHTASFPPPTLLGPIDRKTDYAHLYPASREPWLTVSYTLPTAPAHPLALAVALLAWGLTTVGLPASLAAVLAQGPTDGVLVFWLVRLAALALGHVGWRNEGWGTGSGSAGVVGSALGVGLAVARGLGEARVDRA